MTSEVWVKHPRAWAAAMDLAAKEYPRWTKAFWRKVGEIYDRVGGGYVEAEVTVDECVSRDSDD